MHSLQETYKAQIEELVRASNRLAQIGFVTSQGGNLSYRVAEDVILITPTKVAKGSIQFDDICAVNLKGVYDPFHTRIFAHRPDIKGIVHAHPPILTGFAIAGGDWMAKPFLPEPAIEVGPMIMVPYAEPLSEELAQMFDAVIEKSNGFLMENHGALMCSCEGVFRALEFLEMMEAMGKSILVAKILGNPKAIPMKDVMNLERVIKIREMPMPGLKGVVNSLSDCFVTEE